MSCCRRAKCRIHSRVLLVACLVGLPFLGCPPAEAVAAEVAVCPIQPPNSRSRTLFSKLQTSFDSLAHQSREEDNQALVEMLHADGSFSSVEAGDGVILATFTDGEEIVIFNDRPYDS